MYQDFSPFLYHGTVSEINKVDVSKGKNRKDFGRGFYMAVSKSQAIGMMHKKYKEIVRRNRNKPDLLFHEYLYRIEIDTDIIKNLNVKIFDQADEEWLDFILLCREVGGVPHEYDLVIGHTADDDTLLCLKSYWDGLYGKTGSIEAKKILLKNLEPDNLGVQYYIGSQEAADMLIKEISRIEWNK